MIYQSPRAKIDSLNFGLNLEIPTIVILLAMFVHCVLLTDCRGVFRTFELRVLTVIECPKIAGAKGQ